MSDRTEQIEQIAGVTILAPVDDWKHRDRSPLSFGHPLGSGLHGDHLAFFYKSRKGPWEKNQPGRCGLHSLLALIFFLPLVYVGSKLVGQASIAFDYNTGIDGEGSWSATLVAQGLPFVGERLEGIWQDIGRDTPRLIGDGQTHTKIF